MENVSPLEFLRRSSREAYCYLATKGRKSGNPHEIEIWFVVNGDSLYLMSGGMDKSDWVKNLIKDPNAAVRIAGQTFSIRARIATDKDEEMQARELMADKYKERERDGSLREWVRTALVVGFDLKFPPEK